MPDQLLNLLKIFLLLLLYLFFLRVLRAVWAEVTPQSATAAPVKKHSKQTRRIPSRRSSGPPVLRILLPAELKGRSFPLGEEITLGRAAGLMRLHVEELYRRRGLAVFLLSEAFRQFMRQGIMHVEIQALQSNTAALKLFGKLGFELVDQGGGGKKE